MLSYCFFLSPYLPSARGLSVRPSLSLRCHRFSSGFLHPPPRHFCYTCSTLCPQPSSPKVTTLLVPKGSPRLCANPEQACSPLGPLPASGVFPTDPKCPDTLPSGRTVCRYSHTFSSLFGCSMKCPSFGVLLPLLGATFSADILLRMLSSLLLVTCLPAAPRPRYHRAKMCLLFSTVYCGSLAHNHLRQREKEGGGGEKKGEKADLVSFLRQSP